METMMKLLSVLEVGDNGNNDDVVVNAGGS